MKMIHLSLAALGVGGFLMGLAAVWPSLIGGTHMIWSEEQAEHHARVAHRLHALQHAANHDGQHDHGPGETHAAAEHPWHDGESLRQARTDYAVSSAKLDRARAFRTGPARWFKWTGILFALIGAAGCIAVRGPGRLIRTGRSTDGD